MKSHKVTKNFLLYPAYSFIYIKITKLLTETQNIVKVEILSSLIFFKI